MKSIVLQHLHDAYLEKKILLLQILQDHLYHSPFFVGDNNFFNFSSTPFKMFHLAFFSLSKLIHFESMNRSIVEKCSGIVKGSKFY